ncbi:Asp23/Gls24 family envelope stress response protein [Micromonospora echinofusca]|uniref:Asp23/Gls24 family envelope stress response protein n=1 Tax=Micromonospora echinofusca TaxID=47858 RepID=A0ABS3W1Y4_MICEH|nr:Asp23/Gls24 family envelope stress response protein [Micromonospora echinofusca]MBO4210804.1 Asp23/Gls24 family envelope stress response protein [Micromonospora echinofusca]
MTDTGTAIRDEDRRGNELTEYDPTSTQLLGEQGRTRITGTVVAKIAGHAAREVPGVWAIGDVPPEPTGAPRGAVRAEEPGVVVEVDEQETIVDLEIVTWYGESIVDVSDAVRQHVIDRVREMTGLTVSEVNITVDDVHVNGADVDVDVTDAA